MSPRNKIFFLLFFSSLNPKGSTTWAWPAIDWGAKLRKFVYFYIFFERYRALPHTDISIAPSTNANSSDVNDERKKPIFAAKDGSAPSRPEALAEGRIGFHWKFSMWFFIAVFFNEVFHFEPSQSAPLPLGFTISPPRSTATADIARSLIHSIAKVLNLAAY